MKRGGGSKSALVRVGGAEGVSGAVTLSSGTLSFEYCSSMDLFVVEIEVNGTSSTLHPRRRSLGENSELGPPSHCLQRRPRGPRSSPSFNARHHETHDRTTTRSKTSHPPQRLIRSSLKTSSFIPTRLEQDRQQSRKTLKRVYYRFSYSYSKCVQGCTRARIDGKGGGE